MIDILVYDNHQILKTINNNGYFHMKHIVESYHMLKKMFKKK